MSVDVHAHIFTDGLSKKVPSRFAAQCPQIRYVDGVPVIFVYNMKVAERALEGHFSIDKRLRDMDTTGVHTQLLSIVPTTYCYSLEIDAAKAICRAQNDELAKIVNEHPGRFYGLAEVPLQDAEAAAEELERAVQVNGMVGVQIGANINGMNLDEPSLLPFFRVAEKLGAPIFIHPDNVPALDRIPRYNLRNFIGNPLDTTIAATSLIFGGVLERFPNLKVVLAHGSGFVPYQRGRFARGFKVKEETRLRISRPPDDYISRMYFDTVIHFEPALRYMVETCGARRVVMGSDYPAAMGDPEPVQFVTTSRLKEEEKKLILSENARELFRLDLKT